MTTSRLSAGLFFGNPLSARPSLPDLEQARPHRAAHRGLVKVSQGAPSQQQGEGRGQVSFHLIQCLDIGRPARFGRARQYFVFQKQDTPVLLGTVLLVRKSLDSKPSVQNQMFEQISIREITIKLQDGSIWSERWQLACGIWWLISRQRI